MASKSPGVVRRFFRGLWDALNFTRMLVFNILFVAVLVALIVAFSSSRPAIAPRSALVLDLKGSIVEQYSADPAQRAMANLSGNEAREIQLRDVLAVIDAAATDARIERIVLVPDDISGAGFASLREIGAALERFRAAGKEVVAVSGGMDQRQYLLAAHADHVLLDPEGAVVLEGLSSYRNYYKDALDKLGVAVHLIKVGTFKSAAEPFVLDHASDAAKEADAYWMGGVWQEYLAEVAAARKLDATALADDIAHYDQRVLAANGDLAQVALGQKLVDELATRGEAREFLRKRGVAEGSDGFRQVDYARYLAALGAGATPLAGATVAVVVAEGEIVPGEQGPGTIGGRSTAQLVRAAREDGNVKALVLRVNSPGGDAHASELIRREVEQTRAAGKPVIVSMGDVAASGGYWISMDADEIWAQPNTITGSIGIFGLFVTVPDMLARLGINTDGVGTTPLAGSLDPRRPLSPQMETILTSVIQRGYAEFIGKVAAARGKTSEEINRIAQGRVWDGSQALERGLVDALGGLDEAIAAAAERADLGDDYQVHYIERELSPWERLAVNLGNSEAARALASKAGLSLPALLVAPAEVRELSGLVTSLRGRRYGTFAHCLCELR
ncbi:MAG: signal peptide peptidase SppA [Xanthomonadales bacterium]|nr:signal peptide peptidase SppA [Xanthomonadales bacterium]